MKILTDENIQQRQNLLQIYVTVSLIALGTNPIVRN